MDDEGTKHVKQMITLLAMTGQFIPQNRHGSKRQETDVQEYIMSTDVNSVFGVFLMVLYCAEIIGKQRHK